jgi:sulfur relay (sulfurtransferase) DsrC/TusE family protein
MTQHYKLIIFLWPFYFIKEFKTVPFLKIGLFLNFANFVTKESKITSQKKYFPKFPAEESWLKKKEKKLNNN